MAENECGWCGLCRLYGLWVDDRVQGSGDGGRGTGIREWMGLGGAVASLGIGVERTGESGTGGRDHWS